MTYPHVLPGLWYPAAATKNCASSVRWARDTFCESEIADAERLGTSTFALMDELATACPPGADGLLFHPYLMGEFAPLWDPYARGDFIGLTLRHDKRHLVRAVLEGIALSLRDASQLLSEAGVPFGEIRLIGGGARSRLWPSIVADILGMELRLPVHPDAAAGAAMLAGVGTGLFRTIPEAVERCVRIERTVTPVPERVLYYHALFDVYRDSRLRLAALGPRLRALAEAAPRGDGG